MTTWNPADKSASVTLSNGNFTATGTTSSDVGVRSTTSKTSTKDYMEFTFSGTVISNADNGVGIITSGQSLTGVGSAAANAFICFMQPQGALWFNGSTLSTPVGAIGLSDIVCMAIDRSNQRGWMRKNGGNWNGDASADPATNVLGADLSAVFSGATPDFALCCTASSNYSTIANFGARPFAFAVPAGFSRWDALVAASQNKAFIIG